MELFVFGIVEKPSVCRLCPKVTVLSMHVHWQSFMEWRTHQRTKLVRVFYNYKSLIVQFPFLGLKTIFL